MILSTTISLHPSKPKKRNIDFLYKRQMLKIKKRSIISPQSSYFIPFSIMYFPYSYSFRV